MTAFVLALVLKVTLWAVVTYAAVLVVPAQQPQARRGLALLGMWGVWLVPWLPLPASGLTIGPLPAAAAESQNSGLGTILASIWLLGAVVLVLRLLQEAFGIARLVRHARAGRCDGCTELEVRFSNEIEGPCMTGWLRPCVLLPLEAAAWPETTLQAALRHEYQHARQHDGLHRVCAALLRAVFWWNPALHALCGIYEAESEVCCDLEASVASSSRREYGELLLAHATGMPPHGLAMPFARHVGLRGRIERLLAVPRHSRWAVSARWIIALALIATAGMLMAAIRIAPLVVSSDSAMKTEAMIRLSADPFPGSP